MNEGREEYVFLWFIENYSYCKLKTKQSLTSPTFIADDLNKTLWSIILYPRGRNDECMDSISLFLYRRDHSSPENIEMSFELSLLAADRSILCSKVDKKAFVTQRSWGFDKFIQVDEVLARRRTDYLPQDSLRISCKIWRGERSIYPLLQIIAGTRIVIQQISFVHVVKDFSALEPNKKETLFIKIGRINNCNRILSSSLYIKNNTCCEGNIIVELKLNCRNQIICPVKYKLFLLDISGGKTECGKIDNRFNGIGECIKSLPLSLTRQDILNRKSEYMSDDILSLACECTFSPVEFYNIPPQTIFGRLYSPANQINAEDYDNIILRKLSACPSILEDLKTIYNKQNLTDIVLQTKSKSFPAHKLVLCVRSSVFHTMLTNMKEKHIDCLQVDDIEDEILQQFLLYLYSDKVEKLNWYSSIKLYYVADKYKVEKLKLLCSCFLIDNLNTSNYIELLLLADTHCDCDLKKIVEDFILKHKEEVFGADDWGNLMEMNPLLTSKTMRLKYIRK